MDNGGNSLLPLIAELRGRNIILLSTSPDKKWVSAVKKSIVEGFLDLGLQVTDKTSSNISSWEPRERDHFILLHGAEGGTSIQVASEITSLPPNRLAIIVENRRVASIKGLSSKEHLKVKAETASLDKLKEVCQRILVVFGAPCIKAAETDNVKWSKNPQMITVNKEKDVSLGLSIMSREVHSTSPYKYIALIKSIDTSDSTASVKLKKYMHIQSVNGLLLDGLSSQLASETIRHIEEGPVFLMVRSISEDRSKLTSPATPLTDTPLDTPGRTPPGLPSTLPPQPSPPLVYKGVCRLINHPFELKWTEKPIEVQLRTETLHLIPALITEPKARQQKVTIIGYADSLPVWSDSRGHLIVAVNGVEVLEKGPQDVKKMISETPDKTLVSLVMYLCEEGPKPLAENVYSDIIKSYKHRQDQDTEAGSRLNVDIGFGEQRPINKHPSKPPVYFTGSSREYSTKVYEVMTRGETTSNMQDESSILSRQLLMGETTSNVQAKVDESHSFHHKTSEDISSSTTRPQFVNYITLKSSGSTNSLHSPVEKPSLLTTKCVNDDWNL